MLKRKLGIKEFFFFCFTYLSSTLYHQSSILSLFLFALHKAIISKKRTDFLYNFSGVPVSFAKAGDIRHT
jgi:hypothetical protein